MKIALVGSYKEIGGITTHMIQLSKQLRLLGHDVTIVPSTNLSSLPAFAYYIEKLRNHDVIHVHGLKDLPPVISGYALGEAVSATTVCTAHGFKPPSWFAIARKRILMKESIKHYRALISVSVHVKNRLDQFIGDCDAERFVIYNGVDTEVFDPKTDPSFFEEKYRLHGKKVLLYTGRLVPNKGVQYLIDAFAMLGDEFDGLKLLISGKGPMEDELKSKVGRLGLGEKIEFLGFTPSERLVQLYASSDAVVVPSTYDPMPIVLLEAMSMKKALISTSAGGIPEVVKDGITGILVPPADPAALARAIGRVLQEGVAEKMGNAARNLAEEQFTWERVARQTEDVYSRVTPK
jgi:glycosyltransferase involved in cell wall biosynthesis